MMQIKEGENRPSDVFLALWCFWANNARIDREGFTMAAETWWKLRSWEADEEERLSRQMAAQEAREKIGRVISKEETDGGLRVTVEPFDPELYPVGPIPPLDLDQVKDLHEAVQAAVDRAVAKICQPESGPDRTPEEDPSPAAQDEEAPEPDARKAAEAAKVKSDAGRAGLATRKRNVKTALEELRASGVRLQEIADADRRLSIADVLQMLEAKPVSLPVLCALERAIAALQAKAGPPAEEDMT